jgi:hypothetical protein
MMAFPSRSSFSLFYFSGIKEDRKGYLCPGFHLNLGTKKNQNINAESLSHSLQFIFQRISQVSLKPRPRPF